MPPSAAMPSPPSRRPSRQAIFEQTLTLGLRNFLKFPDEAIVGSAARLAPDELLDEGIRNALTLLGVQASR